MQPAQVPVSLDSIQLPPLCDAVVDLATLSQLEADLLHRTQVHSVQVKHGATRMVGDDVWQLPAAFAALRAGEVRGVQVNYRYEDYEWTDTLLRTTGGYRLVRVQHPAS
jgi:hypothetical protein